MTQCKQEGQEGLVELKAAPERDDTDSDVDGPAAVKLIVVSFYTDTYNAPKVDLTATSPDDKLESMATADVGDAEDTGGAEMGRDSAMYAKMYALGSK